MLQSLAVLSSYRPSFPFSWRRGPLSGVTSGGNLKRLSALPGYHTKKDQAQMIGNGAKAATRGGPGTTWHNTISDQNRTTVNLTLHGSWQNNGWWKTGIAPYSSIAETWPNLLNSNQQAPSGLQAPEEWRKKTDTSLFKPNNINISLHGIFVITFNVQMNKKACSRVVQRTWQSSCLSRSGSQICPQTLLTAPILCRLSGACLLLALASDFVFW